MSEHRPLRITAQLTSSLAAFHPVSLDSLLASQVALRDGYPPPSLEERIPELDCLTRHARGFYHASQAHLVVAGYETIRWSRKGLPIHLLAMLTNSGRFLTSGRFKAYWMPLRKTLPAGMRLTWWAHGDAAGIASLLHGVFGVGAKRNAGHGAVARWTVEPWHSDWSLLRPEDGDEGPLVPARPIPVDLAPDGWSELEFTRLSFPYWRQDGRELLAVPPRPVELEDLQ